MQTDIAPIGQEMNSGTQFSLNRSPFLYIVTLNWNRCSDTLDLLNSISRSTYHPFRTIVVDNGSTDNSPEIIASSFPQVELIINPTNYGFARGINIGIKHALSAKPDYILVINNDTLLHPEAISELIKHASPSVGVLSPVVYFASTPDLVWSRGARFNPWNLEIETSRLDKRRQEGNHINPHPKTIPVDFVTGCAMLIPRSVFEEVGYFDETFFIYYEDADFCRRVCRTGKEILIVPSSRIWHKVSTSSGGGDTVNERYWMARSSIAYFAKYARGIQIPVVIIWRTGSALRTSWRLIWKKKWKSLVAYWRGLLDGIKEQIFRT